jgi:copper transport protein
MGYRIRRQMVARNLLWQAAALLAVCVFPAVAWAHAVLLGSSPAADEVLDSAPAEIELNFNENVGPIFIRVLDATGAEVGSPEGWRVDGNDVFLPLTDTLANGTYILTYRVISADTHPVGSTFVFGVGEPIRDMSQEQMGGGDTGWTWVVAANRTLLYASTLLAAGSALLVLMMTWPVSLWPALAAQGRLAAVVAGVTYLLSVGLGGAEMLMGGAGALFSPDTWRQGLGSTLLPSALIGIPGTLVLLVAFRRVAASTPLLLVGAALAIGGFLVTGHAATAPPVWLMALAVAVHLVCAAFWFAALRPLWLSTRLEEPAESGRLMRAFSQRAIWSVGALFLSGLLISYVQVETLGELIGSDYGVRLVLKIVLFLVLLVFAATNKHRHTPRLEAGEAQAAESMRRSIRIEYGVMVAVLVAAVSLTLPSPPRSAAAAGGADAMGDMGETIVAVGEKRGYAVRAEISPGRTGENMVMFSFTDASGGAVEMQRVDTIWSLPSAGLEGVEREAEKISPMMFHLMTSDLILPGTWQFTVSAYVDDFTKINIPLSAEIR